MATPSLDILLATFRGERYLRQQLDSLLAQTDRDFRILARDDGSDDATPAILAEYAERHPDVLVLLPGGGAARGACGNFAELLAYSRAPYAMFCDQDDHWHPDKVAMSRMEMTRLEHRHGSGIPLLVHGDLRVVDEMLKPIAPSFASLMRLDLRHGTRLNRLLMQNVVTGCTMIMNRALVEAASPIPPGVFMHDAWVALVAGSLGEIAMLERPLIDYRQHGRNVIGASAFSWARVVARTVEGRAAARERINRCWLQVEALLERHGDGIESSRRVLCLAFLAMRVQGPWSRRCTLVRHGFWKNGWVRNLGLLAVL
jgi:hypothetical protein